jgi:hypothetical protein
LGKSEAKDDGKDKEVKIWHTKLDDGVYNYVSVNAVTLDPRQEGLDLSEWTEKGWIYHVDTLEGKERDIFGLPHVGGMYLLIASLSILVKRGKRIRTYEMATMVFLQGL